MSKLSSYSAVFVHLLAGFFWQLKTKEQLCSNQHFFKAILCKRKHLLHVKPAVRIVCVANGEPARAWLEKSSTNSWIPLWLVSWRNSCRLFPGLNLLVVSDFWKSRCKLVPWHQVRSWINIWKRRGYRGGLRRGCQGGWGAWCTISLLSQCIMIGLFSASQPQ